MAFSKYANAAVAQPVINMAAWDEVRSKAMAGSAFTSRGARSIPSFNPQLQMLSHCTIMASVDIENGPGPLGRHFENGFEIDRRFQDYYITPETSKYVNSNGDSWSRALLLATFRTFIGAQNYCFVPGTKLVMADGTQKSIEDVTVGEEVLTHEGRYRRVLRTFSRRVDEEIVNLYFDQCITPIQCTKEHPFLLKNTSVSSDWVEASEIQKDAAALGPLVDGDRQSHFVSYVGREHYKGPVHNIEVEGDNSYVLGLCGLAVHNCEHLQLPEMSKGRVVDAVARDIGESVYIDILVATDRKHKPLVTSIENGDLNTLSMGCTVQHTSCSVCGNVAEDETQLCRHVKYSKRSNFHDSLGKTRIVAELCGHASIPSSVKFIEASWVANPAFKGAVVRNIFSPEEQALLAPKVATVFSMPAPVADPSLRAKAARDQRMAQIAQGDRIVDVPVNGQVVREIHTPHHFHTVLGQEGEEQFEGADDAAPKKAPEADPLDKAVNDLADILKEKALEKVRGEMTKKEVNPRADHDETGGSNNLIHQASQSPHWRSIARVVLSKVQDRTRASRIVTGLMLFKSGGWQSVREANSYSGREVLAMSRFLDEFQGSMIAGETRVYRTVLAVGGVSPYGDVDSYLAACRRIYGRELTTSERDALITKGRIFDLGVS